MEISTEIKGSDMDSDSVFRSSQSTVISQYDEIKMEEGNGEEMIKKKRQRKQLGLGKLRCWVLIRFSSFR